MRASNLLQGKPAIRSNVRRTRQRIRRRPRRASGGPLQGVELSERDAVQSGTGQAPDAFVKKLVNEQGSRQLFAPPPRFTGKVVAQHVDERWSSDVIDFQSKTKKKDAPIYILLVQDIFSRFLFATALRSKAEVESAFLHLLRDTKRKPEKLNSDSGRSS